MSEQFMSGLVIGILCGIGLAFSFVSLLLWRRR